MNQHLDGLESFLESFFPNTFKLFRLCAWPRGHYMAGMDFFIRPATGTTSADWVRIPDADIKVRLTRRMTRTIVRGEEGDNLHDEGSESAIYTISGEMQLDEYKRILAMFRSGQPCIHDPFEERDVKVVFASMEYDGSNESFKFELIEDIV